MAFDSKFVILERLLRRKTLQRCRLLERSYEVSEDYGHLNVTFFLEILLKISEIYWFLSFPKKNERFQNRGQYGRSYIKIS